MPHFNTYYDKDTYSYEYESYVAPTRWEVIYTKYDQERRGRIQKPLKYDIYGVHHTRYDTWSDKNTQPNAE